MSNGELRSQYFRPLPGVSVNRQRYSDAPADVLHVNCAHRVLGAGWGILSFTVGAVENAEPFAYEGGERRYEFYLVHKPTESCKPHSEIYCRDAESKEDVTNPSPTIRNLFRVQLSRLINVVLDAAA